MLTARQRQVHNYIAGHLEATGGVSPSYQEICDALAIKSRGDVKRILDCLVARGAIRKMPGKARALEIVDKAHNRSGKPVIHYRNAAYFRWNDDTKELVEWPPK